MQQKKKWISIGVCLDCEMWLAIKEQYPEFNLSQFVRDALNKEFEIVEEQNIGGNECLRKK